GAPPPFLERVELPLGAFTQPVEVAEHEDVGAGGSAAFVAFRQWWQCAHGGFVDGHRDVVGRPDSGAATGETLQMVNGAVDLGDVAETGALELTVDVGGEHVHAAGFRRTPVAQDGEAGVGCRPAVQLEAMSVESPSQFGVPGEVHGVGDLDEAQPQPGVGRVGAPEALVPAEIGQAGVDAHAGAGADEKSVGAGDEVGRSVERRLVGGGGFGCGVVVGRCAHSDLSGTELWTTSNSSRLAPLDTGFARSPEWASFAGPCAHA